MKQVRLFLMVVLLTWVSFTGTGMAGDWIKPGEEMFRIDAGAFLASFDTTLRIDNDAVPGDGTEINLEDDLNYDDSSYTYLFGGYWRFAKRHRLYASYFVFDRDSSARLNKELVIDDTIYPVDAGVASEFNLKIIPIAYGYSFINNEKHELTGILGLHWYQAEFRITGDALAGPVAVDESAFADADVPLPVIGFSYEYRFTERWTAGALAQAFYLKASGSSLDFTGSLVNVGVKTEYWIFNNVGIGGAVNYFNLNVDVEDGNWKGALDYKYFGPQIYVSVRF
jgi:hypothetical protein